MTFSPTSLFYVTLMSHASTREFPRNRSHHFKNRLPKPIRFVGRGWQVGMVSLSLPTYSPTRGILCQRKESTALREMARKGV